MPWSKYNRELPSNAFSIIKMAGQWLLHSGIQDPSGGVARYFRADLDTNLPLSTEITGYALSGYCYLFEQTQEEEYLLAAQKAAEFLTKQAWDASAGTMPFELSGDQRYSYFFDCGIIARALLWLWRLEGREELLSVALGIGNSMERDFRGLQGFHPIVKLPCKGPALYEIWWSRMPGAFQLKAGLAWLELAAETGETRFANYFEEILAFSLKRFAETLDNEQDRPKQMDRLHAWSYFLEGLQPVRERPEVARVLSSALDRGETLLEELASGFLRSDACSQLLRIRLLLGGKASAEQLSRIESFQFLEDNPRVKGAFSFGRRDGSMAPHANPVSTVFAIQALSMAQAEKPSNFDWRKLF
jgi:hypothetical protein